MMPKNVWLLSERVNVATASTVVRTQSSCSSRPMTMLRAFRLSITLCSRALSFADADIKAGSWLSTRIFSLTRTSWPLNLNVRSASSWAGVRVPPKATARLSRILKPVSDFCSA